MMFPRKHLKMNGGIRGKYCKLDPIYKLDFPCWQPNLKTKRVMQDVEKFLKELEQLTNPKSFPQLLLLSYNLQLFLHFLFSKP